MKIITCAYPPDWSLKETLALPVFLDQIPPRGDTARIDFRLRGLISGLALEELFDESDDWLLIDPARQLAPQIFLIPLSQGKKLTIQEVSFWLEKTCEKLARAGARDCALAIKDLFRENFALREFSEAIIKALLKQPMERVKLYTGVALAEILAQELARWIAHLKPEPAVELEIDFLPEFLQEQNR